MNNELFTLIYESFPEYLDDFLWLGQAKEQGADTAEILRTVVNATDTNGGYRALSTKEVIRGIERERKLKQSYKDRAHYPHLRGGRPNKVEIYVSIAKTQGKEIALKWASNELSSRSLVRLRKLLV